MPELPEVEAARRTIEAEALHRKVETVSVRPDGMTMDASAGTLRSAFRGHQLTAAGRHGKHLFVRSSEERGRWLRLHFGMTGEVLITGSDDEEPDHTRLRFDLAGGRSLAFRCPRKFGEIGLVESPEAFVSEKGLGPDPLAHDFGLREFRDVLDGRSGGIKPTLMNQDVLAGVGNVYSDEAFFQADIHPGAKIPDLTADQVGGIWRALRRVLRKTAEVRIEGGEVPSTWLLPHRDEGADCPRCGGTIRNGRIGGRSSYWCDRHQEKV